MGIDELVQGYWPGIAPPAPQPPLGVTENEARVLLGKLVLIPCTDIKCHSTGIGRQSIVCTRCAAVDQVQKWLPKVSP